VGQLLTQAEPVELVTHELPRPAAAGQVLDTDLVGQGEDGGGDLLIRGKAVGHGLGQHVPDSDQQRPQT